MDKDKILKDFDQLTEAKRKNALNLKLCLGFALTVVLAVLFFCFSAYLETLDKVWVVDKSGEYLKTHAEPAENLFVSLIKNTCNLATQYANSFDRFNLKRNQSAAKCYVNTDDLNAIFHKYYTDGSYHDALVGGAVYKCELEDVSVISGDNEPYKVVFTSLVSAYIRSDDPQKAAKPYQYRIKTEGELIRTTAQYPENVTGFIFTRFIQQIMPEQSKNE